MNKTILFLVSFFMFSGYYAGLSLFYYFHEQELSRFYTIPLRLLLLLMMVFFIIKTPARNSIKVINRLIVIFTIFYIIKVFYTEIDYTKAIPLRRPWYEYIFYYLSYNFIPFLFFSRIDIKKYGKYISQVIVFSGFVFGAIIILIYKDILLAGGIGRISNLQYETGYETINPLSLSYSGALTAALVFILFIYYKNSFYYKLFLMVSLLLSFALIFMGSGRGALIALVFSLIIILLFTKGKNKVYLIMGIVLLSPVAFYIMELTGSNLFTRFSDTINSGDTSGREILWNDALQEFYRYPFFGGYIEVSGIYPHNVFLELLMATGFVGFVIFIAIIIKTVMNGVKLSKKNFSYLIPLIILANGIAQYIFSGAIWEGMLIFAPIGMMNIVEEDN